MLTFRRALVAAAVALTLLFLLTRTHERASSRDTFHLDNEVLEAKIDAAAGSLPKASNAAPLGSSFRAGGGSSRASQQQPIIDMATASLKDKLAYQFPYDLETKFPAYIWQTWKYTPASGEFPEDFRPLEASWTEKHPGFVHEVITDQVAVHLMRHLYASLPEVVEAYNSLPLPVLKADFFRYLILLARGGIYTDIDTSALVPATDWLPESVPRQSIGLVIGIEADPDREDWAQWYSRRIQFCQWTIQAKPGHPVLREIVASITEETLARKRNGTLNSNSKSVVEFTGPALWTDTIFNFFNDERYFDMSTSKRNITWQDFTGIVAPKKVGDVVVLPITSFSPGVQQMGAGELDDPMAFVQHNFEGTWKPEEERHIGEHTA